MKILMTGMTAAHTKTNGNVRVSGAYALLKALTVFGGHDVVVEPPSVHTNPKDYDVILCGLYIANAMTSRHKFKLFEFLHRAFLSGTKVVFYIDDWHLQQIFAGLRRNTPAFKASFKKHTTLVVDGGLWFAGSEEERQNCIANEEIIWNTRLMLGSYTDLPENTKLLVQFFPWGDPSRLSSVIKWPHESIIPWNPDPFLMDEAMSIQPQLIKERAWVVSTPYATVDEWVHKQYLQWPVITTGRKGGHNEKTEPDLFKNVYARYTGVVSHPYPEKLVGMWRNRYLFGLAAGAIIYSDRRESCNIGPEFEPMGVKDMQHLDDDELAHASRLQFNAFMKWQKQPIVELLKIEGVLTS